MTAGAEPDQLILAGPSRGIPVTGAGELAEFLLELIPQWPQLAAVDVGRCPSDDIVVRREQDHWRISSPHLELSDYQLDDGYMVANSLVGALIAAYVAQNSNLISIHVGAVAVSGALLLLLGDNETGKSTLSTALAARGQRLFCDDRLVVDLGPEVPVGQSLAIAPKLRLPLPDEADDRYRQFVDENSLLTWPAMAVLRLGKELAAQFGETLPIRALIHLQRDDRTATPQLGELRQPDMVRILLEQLFAPHLSHQDELAACVRLAQSVDLYALRYASSFAAADALLAHFDRGAAG